MVVILSYHPFCADVPFVGMRRTLMSVVLVGLVVLGGAIFGGGYYESWWLRGPGLAVANARTDVTRAGNQYITSQQTALLTLLGDYSAVGVTEGQRVYIVGQMWNIVSTLEEGRVPAEVVAFLARHPRGSK